MQVKTVYVSYSYRDEHWFSEGSRCDLIPWLARALRHDGIELWYNSLEWPLRERLYHLEQLRSEGRERQPELLMEIEELRFRLEYEREQCRHRIDSADVALLMLSEAYFSSAFIQTVEIPRIMDRAARGEMTVIPILLEPCDWQASEFLAARQIVPGEPTPLIDYTVSDHAWVAGRNEVLMAIRRQLGNREPHPTAAAPISPLLTGATPFMAVVMFFVFGVLITAFLAGLIGKHGVFRSTPAPLAVPAVLPMAFAAPTLLSPPDGLPISGPMTFTWSWSGADLDANHGFEVRLWEQGVSDHRAVTQTVHATSVGIDLQEVISGTLDSTSDYYWTVVVVQREPYLQVGPEAPWRVLRGAPGSDATPTVLP